MKTLIPAILALTALPLLSVQAQDQLKTTSAMTIDPSGGATIKWENPNWTNRFEDIAGLGIWNKSRGGMAEAPGSWLLDFEPVNGFSKATQRIDAEGLALNSLAEIKPFTTAQKISRITSRSGGPGMGVQWRAYDEQNGSLVDASEDGGVFLIADRPAGDVLVSGSQGLVAAPVSIIGSPALRGGVFFTFDQSADLFSVVLNTAPESGATPYYLIVLFDSSNKRIGSFRQGVKAGDALYVGFTIPGGGARSVWVGQASRVNGVVIDDVGVRFAGSE